MLTPIPVEIFENKAFLPIFSVLILDDKGVAISAELRPHLLKICGQTDGSNGVTVFFMHRFRCSVLFVMFPEK